MPGPLAFGKNISSVEDLKDCLAPSTESENIELGRRPDGLAASMAEGRPLGLLRRGDDEVRRAEVCAVSRLLSLLLVVPSSFIVLVVEDPDAAVLVGLSTVQGVVSLQSSPILRTWALSTIITP